MYFPDLDDGLDIEWMRQSAAKPDDRQLLERFHALDADPQAQGLLLGFLDLLLDKYRELP